MVINLVVQEFLVLYLKIQEVEIEKKRNQFFFWEKRHDTILPENS